VAQAAVLEEGVKKPRPSAADRARVRRPEYCREFLGSGLDPTYRYRTIYTREAVIIQRIKSKPFGLPVEKHGDKWGYFAEIRHSAATNTKHSDRVQAARIISAIELVTRNRQPF
jgi:hypothetical protein